MWVRVVVPLRLLAQSGAKVRLSQSSEFYPGTEDRVLLVEGNQDAINVAISKTLILMLEVRARAWERGWRRRRGLEPSSMNLRWDSPSSDACVRARVRLRYGRTP